MYTTLEVTRDGAVTTVWMNRPEVHNAFDERLIDELTRACVELDGDASVRVVVLGGRGKNFSAGADLNWMRRAANNSVDENRRDARRLAEMLRVLAHMSKPTIARVQGAALGGGTGLTAACDMAVAARDAVFSTSEVRFGIIPSAISPYVLRAIGPRQALRYFQSAERIPAERALAIGLVQEVAASEELDRVVAALAAELMSGGPNALAAAKALVRDIAGRPIDAAIGEETAERIARQRATDEAREGISAFLEKRPPNWRP
ncbi:MAG: enoyl-CoA hydratase/isomerase family protein [Rhodocyclaceae bacterium]|nr:enoyl-CoA hydratase/isomerase family protein [Rhodocyclaceae bacterium]